MTFAISKQPVSLPSEAPTNRPQVNQKITVSSGTVTLRREHMEATEMRGWLTVSESALADGWDNPQDSQYDAP
jgi:hypothetical protein